MWGAPPQQILPVKGFSGTAFPRGGPRFHEKRRTARTINEQSARASLLEINNEGGSATSRQ